MRKSIGTVLIALACLLLPSAASANGAMGLALATFEWGPWFAYVLVTIAFEAAAMGAWLRVPFRRALGHSLRANLITAFFGGFFSGIACAFLGFYGGQINPDPFGRTLLLFTLFGVGSALIEAAVWRGALRSPAEGEAVLPPRKITARCLAVHLIGVPVGLAVLLIPARPYPGLEDQVWATRVVYLQQGDLRRTLQDNAIAHQTLPPARSYGELLQMLKPGLGRFADDPGLWAAAYIPDYHRFDTTEERRQPIEWNPRAAGRKVYDRDGIPFAAGTFWLTRSWHRGYSEGLVWEPDGLHRVTDRHELGYDGPKTPASPSPIVVR